VRWGVLCLLAACGFESTLRQPGSIDAAEDTTKVDAAVDAAIADAPPFDVSMCPSTYNRMVAASQTRYRVIITDANFATHHASCNSDLPGRTHLVVFDSPAEATQVAAIAGAFFYLGGVQAPDSGSPNSGWFGFDGEPLVGTWDPGEPIDIDNVENNEQNLAGSELNAEHWDVGGAVVYNAVCECDGNAIPPQVLTMIAAAIP
jgi:hypothetical protein